jgi:polysaccharide pyruvyl transferase CsaB
MLDVVFCGYFGFGNLGDELIVSAVVEELFRELPDCRIGVLVGPEGSRLPAAVTQVARRDAARASEALASCRVLAVGPGGIFQDATSLRSCVWYACVVRRARRAGARVVHVAQSVGPLDSLPGRLLTRGALRGAEAVLLRDESSLDLVRRLGCEGNAIRTADAAWLVPAPRARARDGRPRLALAPRPWSRRGMPPAAWWAELANAAAGTGREVVGLAMSREDLRLLEQVARLTGRKAELLQPATAEEALGVLASCEALVGMRLHSLILGALAGCRLLGVSYDPKVEGLLGALGLVAAAKVDGVPPPAEIASLAADPGWGTVPRERIEDERRRARRNVEVLAGVIATAREEAASGA